MIYIIGNDGTPVRVDGVGNELYPVGSIYMSTENTSPASMFGGTWEQILGKFLLSSDDVLTYDDAGNGTITTAGTYHAGATGGEATHTLTIDEMPSHTHEQRASVKKDNSTTYNAPPEVAKSGWWEEIKDGTTYETGGGQAHNNMPPYLAVYCWKRIP